MGVRFYCRRIYAFPWRPWRQVLQQRTRRDRCFCLHFWSSPFRRPRRSPSSNCHRTVTGRDSLIFAKRCVQAFRARKEIYIFSARRKMEFELRGDLLILNFAWRLVELILYKAQLSNMSVYMCVRGERWLHSQSLFILASCVWFVLQITVFFQRWKSTISIVMGNLQWRKISSRWWLCSWRGRPATTERGCDGYDCPVPEMGSCRNWEGMLWSYFADIDGRCQR